MIVSGEKRSSVQESRVSRLSSLVSRLVSSLINVHLTPQSFTQCSAVYCVRRRGREHGWKIQQGATKYQDPIDIPLIL